MEFIAFIIVIGAVVFLQNWIFSRFSLKNLEYDCRLSCEEADEGDEIELIETILNRKWLPVPWLKSEITTSRWLDFAGAQSIVTDKTRFVPSFFMVKSYQKVQRVWKVTCLKRGEFSIQRVGLVSTDLLGNVSLARAVEADSQVLVLPKGIELEEVFIAPKSMNGDMAVRKNLLEDPFFIAGVREYTERDPMNRVHWTATAKEQRLMVYNCDSTSSQSLSVILNIQSRRYENTDVVDSDVVENCIRTCASVLSQTLSEQLPVRLFCNGSVTEQRVSVVSNDYWGEEHVQELLRILAKLRLVSTQDFCEYLNELYDHVNSSDVVIVTPYLCEEICDFARNKRIQNVRVKLFVLGRVNSSDIPADCEVYCIRGLFCDDENGGDSHEEASAS